MGWLCNGGTGHTPNSLFRSRWAGLLMRQGIDMDDEANDDDRTEALVSVIA